MSKNPKLFLYVAAGLAFILIAATILALYKPEKVVQASPPSTLASTPPPASTATPGDDDDEVLAPLDTSPTTTQLPPSTTSPQLPTADQLPPPLPASWVSYENSLPGISDWGVGDNPANWEKIRGYADATSVVAGQSVNLRVKTNAPWHLQALRMGYYSGAAARVVFESPTQPPSPQATAQPSQNPYSSNWDVSYNLSTVLASPNATPCTKACPTFPPGFYMLRLLSDDGGGSYVLLVVRDVVIPPNAVGFQSASTTSQAYNGFGGASLYTGDHGRSPLVSFDRPYTGNGSGEFLGRERELIVALERWATVHKVPLTYWTDIDLHEHPDIPLHVKAVVIGGHDEYYSRPMFDALVAARDSGVNLAVFGANSIYRKIRFQASNVGPDRIMVNYRSTAGDPVAAKDPQEATVSWRESPINRPESELLGGIYECNPVDADLQIANQDAWLWSSTGLRNGDKMPHKVGNEYDRFNAAFTHPSNIEIMAHSPVSCKGNHSFADITYYTAASGAGVLDIGTFRWVPALVTDCSDAASSPRLAHNGDCALQQATDNVFDLFSAGPAGQSKPSSPNVKNFWK